MDTDTGIPRARGRGAPRARPFAEPETTEEISLLLDQPLPKRGRRRRVSGIGLLFLLLVLCAVAVGGTWWFAYRDTRADDFGLTNAQRVLEEAEATFRITATSDAARLHPDARCYFSRSDGRADVDDHLRCGPVLRFDGDEEAAWDSVALTFGGDGDAVRGVAGAVTETGVRLSPSEILARPDGLAPPTDLSGFTVPDPPPMAAGARLVLDEGDAGIELTPSDEGLVRGPDWALHVEGVRRGKKLGTGGARMVAADGEELVAVKLRLAEPAQASEATVGLVVEGDRQPFALWEQLGDDARTVVVSVPEGTGHVSLEIAQAGVTQQVSLLDGRRAVGYPGDLYRDPDTGAPVARIDQTYRTGGGAPAGAEAAGGVSLRLRSAVVGPWARLPDGTLRGAAPGTSLLVLDLDEVAVSPGTCAGPVPPGPLTGDATGAGTPVPAPPAWQVDWAGSFSLTPTVPVVPDPDAVAPDADVDVPVPGEPIGTTPVDARPPVVAQVQDGSGRVVFEVPEGVAGGLVDVALRTGCGAPGPGSVVAPSGKSAEFSFPG